MFDTIMSTSVLFEDRYSISITRVEFGQGAMARLSSQIESKRPNSRLTQTRVDGAAISAPLPWPIIA